MPAPRSRRLRSPHALAVLALLTALVATARAPRDAGAAADHDEPAASASEIAGSAFGVAQPRPAEPEQVATQRVLGIASVRRMLVDDARGHVYFAGDDSVVVTDLSGSTQQTLSVPGAADLAIVGAELFVAQPTVGTIARVSLSTLTVGAPLVTGLVSNRTIGYAGGALWTTSGPCYSHDVQLVRVQLSDGSTTAYPDLGSTVTPHNYYCPIVVASGDHVVLAETQLSPTTLQHIDVSTGHPVFTDSTRVSANAFGMQISDAGDLLLLAGNDQAFALHLPSLAPAIDFGAATSTGAIAHSAANGGRVAIGSSWISPNLHYVDTAHPDVSLWSLDLPELIAALQFDAAGTHIYAVSRNSRTNQSILTVIDVSDPTLPPTTTTAPPTTTTPSTTAPRPSGSSQFGEFHALDPARIYDSRTIGARVSQSPVQITGRGGVPASGVSAVAVNVTVTEPTEDGYLSVYPAGQAPPTASTLNYRLGQTVPNMAIVGVGANGQLGLFALTPTHVIVDVIGWFGTADAPSGTLFHPVLPFRWFDTRTGTRGDGSIRPVGPGQVVFSSATGGASPQASGITAVAMNVTAANTTASSFLTVTPYGAPLGSSNLNWTAGEIVPNAVISRVDDAAGRVQFTNHAGSTDVIVDSSGYWDTGSGANGRRFTPITPRRMVDTRLGFLASGSTMQRAFRVPAGGFLAFKANANLPAGADTAVLNVTAVNPGTDGFLSVFPLGQPYAEGLTTSVVNFTAGSVRPNMTIMPMGVGGEIIVANGSGAPVDVVVDMTGYFGS